MEKINLGKVIHLISIRKCGLSLRCLTPDSKLSVPDYIPMQIPRVFRILFRGTQ